MSSEQNITAFIKDKKGNILSIGQNNYVKTHPYQALCASKAGMPEKIYLHAEIAAIIKCKDLSKAHSIHIFRYGKTQNPLLAKPCKICALALKQAGIKEIYHT
jgi:tRNA(Arg) A34 adenosine deaminase TadA